MKKCPIPPTYQLLTVDQVAECVDYHRWMERAESQALYTKLWAILDDCLNPTPLGGDGSRGTVETPDGRLDSENDDKAPHWWDRLSIREQSAIVLAALTREVEWLT